jgi:hypothetical protein
MSLIYSSNFDSDTAGTLPSGWANKVGNWKVNTVNPVSGANEYRSESNVDGDVVLYSGASALAAMEFASKQKAVAGAAYLPLVSHIVRSDSANNNHYAVIFSNMTGSSGKVLFFKKIGGSYSLIGSAVTISLAFSAGDTIFIKTTIIGNAISAYAGNGSLPGSPLATITDSSVTAAGYPGLYNSRDAQSVSLTIDDFSYSANTVPDAPTIGTASAGSLSASVVFTAPGNDGGSAITGYTATSTPGSITGAGASSPITVSGLTAGTPYTFTVHATSAIGNSAESAASNSVTPTSSPATAVTMTGPTTGNVGSPSSNFTIGANGSITGTIVVTPADAPGGGAFTPTTVSISTGTPTATFTYTAASAGAKTISVTNDGGLTSPSNITYTAAAGPVAVSVGDANWRFSALNWDTNAGKKIAINGGAKFAIGFTGTSISIGLDVSSLVAGSVTSAWYPSLRYSVDDGAQTDVQLNSSSTALTISGLASGSHEIVVYYLNGFWENIGGTAPDRWTTPVYCIKITGATIDNGATTVAPPWRSGVMVAFGDSIFEGIRANYGTTQPACQNAYESAPMFLAAAFDCELGNISFGGHNYGAGFNSIPGLNTSYANYYNGRSRLSGGLFVEQPNHILICLGANGNPASSDVNAAIVNMRAAAPTAHIFIIIPYGGTGRSNITAAVSAYLVAHPSEVMLHLIDLGATWQRGLGPFGAASEQAIDSLHPRSNWNARIATAIAVKMQQAIDGTVAPTLTTRTASITLGGASGVYANLTNIRVDFYDENTGQTTIARYQSTTETTDSNGVLTFSVGTTLASGSTGSVTIRQASTGLHYNGPMTVT